MATQVVAVVVTLAVIACVYSYTAYASKKGRERLMWSLIFFLSGLLVADVIFGVLVAGLCCARAPGVERSLWGPGVDASSDAPSIDDGEM